MEIVDNIKDSFAIGKGMAKEPFNKANDYIDKRKEKEYNEKVSPLENRLKEKYQVELSNAKKKYRGLINTRRNKNRILIARVSVNLAMSHFKKAEKEYDKLLEKITDIQEKGMGIKKQSFVLNDRANRVIGEVSRALNYLDDPANSVSILGDFGEYVRKGKSKPGRVLRTFNLLRMGKAVLKSISKTANLRRNKKADIDINPGYSVYNANASLKTNFGEVINPNNGEINENLLRAINPKNLSTIVAPEEIKYDPETDHQQFRPIANEDDTENYLTPEESEYEPIMQNNYEETPTETVTNEESKLRVPEENNETPEVVAESTIETNEQTADNDVISSSNDLLKEFNREETKAKIEEYAKNTKLEPVVVETAEEEPTETVTNEENKPLVTEEKELKDNDLKEILKELTAEISKLKEQVSKVEQELVEANKKNAELERQLQEIDNEEEIGKHFYHGKHFADEKDELVQTPMRVKPRLIKKEDIPEGKNIIYGRDLHKTEIDNSLPITNNDNYNETMTVSGSNPIVKSL